VANNRMCLVCNACGSMSPTLMKYYPSTDWYLFARPGGTIDMWLEDHMHPEREMIAGIGPTNFSLAFEHVEERRKAAEEK